MARRRTPEPTASPARGAVLVVVAVVVGLFLLRNGLDTSETVRASDDRSEADATDEPSQSSSTTVAEPVVRPPAEVPVVVLNGTKVAGAAGRWSEGLGARGYQMGKPGDAEPDVSATQVLFGPGYEAEAAGVVEALGSPAGVAPVALPATPPGEIGAAQVVVVIGPDLASNDPPAAG